MSFALDELDKKVLPHLPDRPGVFVEAGAHDGLTQSNTAMLEFSFGWTGLLVEPIPELAARCRLNRPGALVEQAALVAGGYGEDSIRMTYCNRSSIVEGGRGSHARDAAWLEACRRIPDQRTLQTYDIVVPARTLSAILDERRVSEIDFMSLDLEGYEAAALCGLELDRHRPTMLLVEISRERQEIERALHPWYDEVAELSDHRADEPPWYDVLYRAR
jgi:FkbM family methyltransferase